MIRIVFSSFGVFIGERNKSEADVLSIKNPRQIIIHKPENGKEKAGIQFTIGEPFGHPEVIDFNRSLIEVNQDVHDENIIRAYKESTTGLTLVRAEDRIDLSGKPLN
jgi:hypothetical protein